MMRRGVKFAAEILRSRAESFIEERDLRFAVRDESQQVVMTLAFSAS